MEDPFRIRHTQSSRPHGGYILAGSTWPCGAGEDDADGDGIGDTPYDIDSDKATYPLMEPFEN